MCLIFLFKDVTEAVHKDVCDFIDKNVAMICLWSLHLHNGYRLYMAQLPVRR
jgi:hypothetical protein